MITRNQDGDYQLRTGDLSVFLSVIEEQYKVYSDFSDKKIKFNEMNEEEIIRLNHNQIDPLYICTVFSAMFLEAYIYDYIARKKSANFAKSLDKLEPPNKWAIGTQLCNESGIDTSKESYSKLTKLFILRNKLAHNKSKEFSWNDSTPKDTEQKY